MKLDYNKKHCYKDLVALQLKQTDEVLKTMFC